MHSVSGLNQTAFVALQCAAERLMDDMQAVLKPHGLSYTQYSILVILRDAGDDGLPCGEIGHKLIQREPDMTRLLDRLERASLIERCRAATDRRVVRARLATQGSALVAALEKPVADAYRRQFAALGRKGAASLLELLNLLLAR